VQKAGMSYVYDEDGTLIAQTLTGGAQSSWGQSARYIYLPTASGPMPVAAIYGTKHYAVQSDHLNTPRRLIQSDGQVAWQWAYSAFGDEQPTIAKNRFANVGLNQAFGSSTVPAVTFNLRYPGQYFDQESNLHYNLNRSYCPGCGRYTQADPIGLRGGWNGYSYVGQNPLSFTDPTGLVVFIPPAVIWAAGIIGIGGGAWWGITHPISGPTYIKPPDNAYDPKGPKAPGQPGADDGYFPPKGGPNWVPNPNPGKGGSSWGWEDKQGDVWCPTGQGGNAHGGPHWDVQTPGGDYRNVKPKR
jgi:RHS repeat-associated protein